MARFSTVLVGLSMMLVVVLGAVQAQDFFDYSEVGPDNPLAYLWNNRNTLVQDNRASCTVRTASGAVDSEGTCMNAAQCRFSRGKAVGRGTCSFWNSCCVFEKTSNQTSDARVTYFVSPANPRSLPQAQRMYVRLANRNVCQMRIDIINLQLAPAALSTDMTMRTCTLDNFFIEPAQPENRIPEICGTNNNQHFYVHLTPNQILNNAIILNVRLDTTTANLIEPRWNIKVTQLECPTRQRPFDLQHKDNRNQAADDFSRLAPAGCLQYFTEPSGTFKSFGYNSATDSVLNTNQNYAICFKRLPNSCGVDLTRTTLKFRKEDMCTEEFLDVPGLAPASRICKNDMPVDPIISSHPGPLYVQFFSPTMVTAEVAATVYGFEIAYKNNVACT